MRGITRHAAALSGVAEATILGRTRYAAVTRLRHAIVWVALCQAEAGGYELSTPQIGRRLGGRDHSTVISSRNRAAALLPRDAEFALFVERLWAASECAPDGPADYQPVEVVVVSESEHQRDRMREMARRKAEQQAIEAEWRELLRPERCLHAGHFHEHRPIGEAELARRRGEGERLRSAHEAHWLDREQTKYRLPQRGRPLSSQAV